MRMQNLARFGFGYAATLLAVSVLGAEAFVFCFPVLFLLLLAGVCFGPLRTSRTFWCVVSAAVFAASAFFCYTRFCYEPAVRLDGETGKATLTVSDRVFYEGSCRYEFFMTSFDGEDLASLNLYCYTAEPLGLTYGDVIEADLTLHKVTSELGGWGDYCRSRELFLEGEFLDEENPPLPVSSAETPDTFFRKLRDALGLSLARGMPEREAAAAEGMLLGGDGKLSVGRRLTFSRAGVSHLFAVSGLHMTVVIQLVMLLLSFLRFKRKSRIAIGLFAVCGFILLTGGAPSVLRSGVMTAVLLFGEFFRRRSGGLNSLGIAALLICLANPYAMYDIGFLLSLTATLGILVFTAPISRRLCAVLRVTSGWGRALVSLFGVSFAAVLGTLPVTLLCFQELSLVGFVFNPLINFLVTAILFFGFAAAFLGLVPFLGGAASFFGALCGWAVRTLEYGASFVSELPFAFVPLGKGMGLAFFATVLLLWLAVYLNGKRKGVFLPLALSAALLLTGASAVTRFISARSLSVTAVFPQGKSGVLVEAGDTTFVYGAESSASRTLLRRELLARGVNTVDYYLLPGSGAAAVKTAREFSEIFDVKRIFVCEDVLLKTNGFTGEGCETFLLSDSGISVAQDRLSLRLYGEKNPVVDLCYRGKRCLFAETTELTDGFTDKPTDLLVAKSGSPERDLPSVERIFLLSSEEEGKDTAASVFYRPEAVSATWFSFDGGGWSVITK